MPAVKLGPGDGTVEVHTYREGAAKKVGHDLVIDVRAWSATVDTEAGGGLSAVSFEVDSTSLHVREGNNGLKPLSDKDRIEIRKTIDAKILHGSPITFRSSGVDGSTISGELTIDGTTRPASFTLAVADGRAAGTLIVTQTEFGITPYKALMGALKVRDEVEVVLDIKLPA
jgi:polyisoprenoid-binding protein YceI